MSSPIDNVFPYLLDRNEQEEELLRALVAHREEKRGRPLICLVHGDELECHSLYLKRMRERSLPAILTYWYPREAKEFPILDYDMKVPLSRATDPEFENLLWDNLRAATHGNQPFSRDDVVNFIAEQKLAVIIRSSMLTDDLRGAYPSALAFVLKFWNDWPEIPKDLLLFVCISIKYQKRTAAGRRFFRMNWKHNRRNKQIRGYINSLDLSGYYGIHGAVLPELHAIPRSDAEALINHEVVADSYDFRDQDIRSLYERQELCTPEGCIPMETLLNILTKMSKERQRYKTRRF